MVILSWNCRGLTQKDCQLYLQSFIKKTSASLCFLMETKRNDIQIDSICKNLGFQKIICIEVRGLAGGHAVMWKKGINLKKWWHSDRSIYCDMVNEQGGIEWSMVSCYGTSYIGEKEEFWKEMEARVELINNPWLLFGDLNKIVSSLEKLGGRDIWRRKLYLKVFMQELGAIDLGFSGCRFTWENGQEGNASIKERIDRAIVDKGWLNLFRQFALSICKGSTLIIVPFSLTRKEKTKGAKDLSDSLKLGQQKNLVIRLSRRPGTWI